MSDGMPVRTSAAHLLPLQMLLNNNDVPTTLDTTINVTELDAIEDRIVPSSSSQHANKTNLAKKLWWNTPITATTTVLENKEQQQQLAATIANQAAILPTQQQRKNSNRSNQNNSHKSNILPQRNNNNRTTGEYPASDVCQQSIEKLSMPAHLMVESSEQDEIMSYQVDADNRALSEDYFTQNSQLLINDPKPCVGFLNQNEEDEMQVTGYRRCRIRTFFCWLLICLTAGVLRLVLHWWRHWYLIATHEKCPLDEAETVLVEEAYQGKHKIYYVKTVDNIDVSRLRENFVQSVALADTSNDLDANRAATPPAPPIQLQLDQHNNRSSDEKHLHLSVHFSSAHFRSCKHLRMFSCKQLRYAWDTHTQTFQQIKGLDVNVSSMYFYQQKGLPANEQVSRRLVYGPNEITVPYKDVKTLLVLEMLNPFYVFQIFSVVLWFAYNYYYYACVIILMSVFGITMSILQTKKNQDALRETVHNTGCALVLSEKGNVSEVATQYLVPGDIIEIPTNGCTMQCDAVLLSGNCILDEAMLTGESVPVTKTPLPFKRDSIFDKKEHARHTLFCGTKVIQTRYIGSEKVLAIVINTGNITTKGGLIRSILYPPPVDYKFEKDSYKFIECLGLIALVGFTYTLVTKIMREIDPLKIAIESLDLITIVVPPALPAAMTVGRFYAQRRLERNQIYCISPRSINVAGSIDCCCFDKTGTLTEDGLDMWGVVPKSATNQFQIAIKDMERLPCDNFLFGMVTCHSITIMNGVMRGDPLDLKMFESTGWLLEDQKDIPDSQKYGLIHPTIVRQPKPVINEFEMPLDETVKTETVQRQNSMDDLLADVGLLNGESNNDHGIIREFPFTSSLQRMSVITRRLCEKNFTVYCKGSPEMLQQLCLASSIPENFSQQLAIFAKQGYRVIALAYKTLSNKMNYTKAQRLTREAVECDLEFLGFVVLENRLKPDTSAVIESLNAANMRTIMVTGDNILTALSVARDCGIVSAQQAVVTVNVRQQSDNEALQSSYQQHHQQHKQQKPEQSHNYELYYTLELGTAECTTLSNGNGRAQKELYNSNGGPPTLALVGNGDVMSLNADTLPNSNSLTSVQTCETWTHRDEIDLEAATHATVKMNASYAPPHTSNWQRNYRFAMAGKTWQIVREHFPNELGSFLTRGAIFARMSPEHKQSLVLELQNLDYCVAMCGDGANDCGALKVAHTGISLSELESSIASPFTSRNPTIACVPNVIKEGRAALVTSFGIFKYMAAYSMVQFVSVMILYSIDSNLTDKQYLYIDLGLITIFAFFFGKTEATAGPPVNLVPLNSLISLTPLASLILHLLVVVVFQVAGWYQLHQQSWFVPFQFKNEEHLGCYENYTMFAISCFQYIILAFVFSKGAPYRKPIWSNMPFCLTIFINLAIVIYLIVYPADWLANFFELVMPPVMSFRYLMLAYGVVNFCLHLFVELFVVEFLIFKNYQVRRSQNLRTSKRKHMRIEYDLQCLKNWPQITDVHELYNKLPIEQNIEMDPTYVEISAEQSFEVVTPTNNALINFFEVDAGTTATKPTETTEAFIECAVSTLP